MLAHLVANEMTALTSLNLDGFDLNIPKLRGTEATIRTIDLSNKGLGVASLVVIAQLLKDNTSIMEFRYAAS